jgi:hypothetical protein
MIDKICINFIGGSLGHLVLKGIYHHWPLIFNQRTDQIDTVNHDNHQVRADLFCRDSSKISDDDMKLLRSLAGRKNAFLLCHNADLIPCDMQKKFAFINILCSDYHKPEVNFLFACKNTYISDWALIKQRDGFDSYEIMFKEFCRMSKEIIKIQPGVDLDFGRLGDYQQLILALDFVKEVLDLPDYRCHREWYETQYANSIAPLSKYKEFFDLFRYYASIWSTADTRVGYREVVDDHREFEKLVNFFFGLHDKYYAMGE